MTSTMVVLPIDQCKEREEKKNSVTEKTTQRGELKNRLGAKRAFLADSLACTPRFRDGLAGSLEVSVVVLRKVGFRELGVLVRLTLTSLLELRILGLRRRGSGLEGTFLRGGHAQPLLRRRLDGDTALDKLSA